LVLRPIAVKIAQRILSQVKAAMRKQTVSVKQDPLGLMVGRVCLVPQTPLSLRVYGRVRMKNKQKHFLGVMLNGG